MRQCTHCGNKIGLFSSVKLYGGKRVCKICYEKIPRSFQQYRYLDYQLFEDGYDYGERVLNHAAPSFLVTAQYGRMALDEKNGLIYFGDATDFDKNGHLKRPTVNIYHCMSLLKTDIQVKPSTVHAKAGYVECGVLFTAVFENHEIRIVETLKKHAHGNLLVEPETGRMSFSEPADLTAFRSLYNQMVERAMAGIDEVEKALEKKRREDEWMAEVRRQMELEIQERVKRTVESQQKAMDRKRKIDDAKALFMVQGQYDISQLKAQRALLLKTFHPDNNQVESAIYAQKINDAYRLLSDALNEE